MDAVIIQELAKMLIFYISIKAAVYYLYPGKYSENYFEKLKKQTLEP